MSKRRDDFIQYGEPIGINCAGCGKPIVRTRSMSMCNISKVKFCSMECARSDSYVEVGEETGNHCLFCEKPIVRVVYPNGAAESSPAARAKKFYSVECHNKHMRESGPKNFWWNVDVRGKDDCWEWQGPRSARGYGKVRSYKHGVMKHTLAPRMAWELTHGEIPDKMCVLHSCDNPPCTNPEHLHIGTVAENNRERTERGRNNSRRGSNHHNSKLSEEQVSEIIRQVRSGGVSYAVIGEQYNVGYGAIQSSASGKTWGHVTGVVRNAQ